MNALRRLEPLRLFQLAWLYFRLGGPRLCSDATRGYAGNRVAPGGADLDRRFRLAPATHPGLVTRVVRRTCPTPCAALRRSRRRCSALAAPLASGRAGCPRPARHDTPP